jgi:hypothetical protein
VSFVYLTSPLILCEETSIPSLRLDCLLSCLWEWGGGIGSDSRFPLLLGSREEEHTILHLFGSRGGRTHTYYFI